MLVLCGTISAEGILEEAGNSTEAEAAKRQKAHIPNPQGLWLRRSDHRCGDRDQRIWAKQNQIGET